MTTTHHVERGECGPSSFYASEQLADQLALQLAERWRNGEKARPEEYFDRHPQLRSQPLAAARLIYEELCQRRERGESPREPEFLARFPEFSEALAILFGCHELVQRVGSRYPVPGEDYAGLHLLGELGSGASSRVYLAAQSNVGNRPVVLKMTRLKGMEHISLARLQHTHIVPLYWAEDDPKRGLRLLCMPYLGGVTLAHLLAALDHLPPQARTGPAILSQIDREPVLAEIRGVKRGAGRKFLEGASASQAWCGIAICLAEALHDAHEAGLVHLDIKPSNVLIAADGKPLLLDFHLARGPLDPNANEPLSIGGTPKYMSPEQAWAFQAIREGERPPARVDHRSDIYSLGRLLEEMLALSAKRRDRDLNRVIARCVAEKPDDRYSSAAEMAADLKGYLEGKPISSQKRGRAFAIPSSGRRFGKLIMLLAAAGLFGWVAVHGWREHLTVERTQSLLDMAEHDLSQDRLAEADQSLAAALSPSNALWWLNSDQDRLNSLLAQARLRHGASSLRQCADTTRIQIGVNPVDARVSDWCVRMLDEHGECLSLTGPECNGCWAEAVKRDIVELRFLANAGPGSGAREVMDRWPGLKNERLADTRLIACLVEHPREASAWVSYAPQGGFEYYLRGRAWCLLQDFERANRDFEMAVSLQPDWPWSAYCLGHCHLLRGRWTEAAANFSTAIALLPKQAECRMYRAQAYHHTGELARALVNYDQALALKPELADAALGRGTVRYALGRFSDAIVDFQRARDSGADATLANYNLALAYHASHDAGRALQSVRQALRANPRHEASRLLERKLVAGGGH